MEPSGRAPTRVRRVLGDGAVVAVVSQVSRIVWPGREQGRHRRPRSPGSRHRWQRIEFATGRQARESRLRPPQALVTVALEKGQSVDLVLRHERDAEAMASAFRFAGVGPQPSAADAIDEAVRLASDADMAVVVVGTTDEVETEGFDRSSLKLPGMQDELISTIADANPNTIVIVNAGAPVEMPWSEAVRATLVTWFPGQECSNALADVLLGASEPGGRLPTTWWRNADGLPDVEPIDGDLVYDEALAVGYRDAGDGREIQFPFGHGLGYTDWDYVRLAVARDAAIGSAVKARVTLHNSGHRSGAEVVQIYVSRAESEIPRPPIALAGFAKVTLDGEEETEVAIELEPRVFEHWDEQIDSWVAEPGIWTIHAGRSVTDLRVSGEIELLSNGHENVVGSP